MKVCNHCQDRPTYPDDAGYCRECHHALDEFVEPVAHVGDATTGTDTPAAVPSQSCPVCGIQVAAGLPFCAMGHQMDSVTPVESTPGARPASVPSKVSVPHIELKGVEFACRAGDVLGRKGVRADLFAEYQTVSGHQCAILEVNGQWFLQSLPSAKNPNFLDGRLLAPGVPEPLVRNHLLQMSSRCAVRITLKPALDA